MCVLLIHKHVHKRIHTQTHYVLITSNGDIDLRKHWPRKWLDSWRHQPLIDAKLTCHHQWNSVIFAKYQFLLEVPKTQIRKMSLKSPFVKLLPHLQGANALTRVFSNPSHNVTVNIRGQNSVITMLVAVPIRCEVISRNLASNIKYIYSNMLSIPLIACHTCWLDTIVQNGRRQKSQNHAILDWTKCTFVMETQGNTSVYGLKGIYTSME